MLSLTLFGTSWAFTVTIAPGPPFKLPVNSVNRCIINSQTPKQQILDSSKLKDLANDNRQIDKNGRTLS